MLCVDPSKRASLNEILAHRWIDQDVEMKEKVAKMLDNENNKYQKHDIAFITNDSSDHSNNPKKIKITK